MRRLASVKTNFKHKKENIKDDKTENLTKKEQNLTYAQLACAILNKKGKKIE